MVSCDARTAPPTSARRVDPESLAQEPLAAAAKLVEGRLVGAVTLGREPGALTNPGYVDVREADRFLRDTDLVFVVRGNEGTIAYPRILLSLHHVVNETIDGRPVLISYCQLSECGRAFSRVVEGQPLSFGFLRALYNGTLVLADLATRSLWVQFLGACFRGTYKGKQLEFLGDLEQVSWAEIRSVRGLKVLRPVFDPEACRDFCATIEVERLGIRALRQVGEVDARLPPYTRGVGLSVRGDAKFFRSSDVAAQGLIEEEVGGWAIVVLPSAEAQVVHVFRRQVGGRVLSFRRQGERLVDQETRSVWNLSGECVEGEFSGRRLERPDVTRSWWFAWSSFYPRTRLRESPGATPRRTM